MPPISSEVPDFDVDDGYRIARRLAERRLRSGWRPIGRKIGFTNRTLWPVYGVGGPMWANVYDRSVAFAAGGRATVSLATLVQPRIEPEIAVRFASAPAGDGPHEMLAAIEWIAPAFELVHCHYPDWKFQAADTIADFGLHGRLVIGTPVPVADHRNEAWLRGLGAAEVTLQRAGTVVARGCVEDVLGGPLHALAFLKRLLARQPDFPPIGAGEVVTTGTVTDAYPIAPGETWRSICDGLPLPGLAVSFVP
jgi:2-oxo-3-hexenedioate decarboxylase